MKGSGTDAKEQKKKVLNNVTEEPLKKFLGISRDAKILGTKINC